MHLTCARYKFGLHRICRNSLTMVVGSGVMRGLSPLRGRRESTRCATCGALTMRYKRSARSTRATATGTGHAVIMGKAKFRLLEPLYGLVSHPHHIYIYVYAHPPQRHAKMHILPIYPEQLLGNDCENPKIQESKNLKIQKSKNPKKMQDSVDVRSFGFLDFFYFRFLGFWIFGFSYM